MNTDNIKITGSWDKGAFDRAIDIVRELGLSTDGEVLVCNAYEIHRKMFSFINERPTIKTEDGVTIVG